MARRHKPVTLALLRLHADLLRKLERANPDRPSLRVDIWHVECVIRLLEPGVPIRRLDRRRPNPWFKHGTIFPAVIAVLRTAERPMHTREITWAIIVQRGIRPDSLSIDDLMKSVERSLRYHQGRSIVAIGSRPVHWKLAD
jgi:hypothetical protein